MTVRGFPFSIYSPQGKYEGRFDPKDCPVTVHEPGRGIFMHQCRHKPKRSVEGFPDIVMCEIHAKAAEERLGLRKSNRSPTQFERELERIKKSAEERAELLAQRDALRALLGDLEKAASDLLFFRTKDNEDKLIAALDATRNHPAAAGIIAQTDAQEIMESTKNAGEA